MLKKLSISFSILSDEDRYFMESPKIVKIMEFKDEQSGNEILEEVNSSKIVTATIVNDRIMINHGLGKNEPLKRGQWLKKNNNDSFTILNKEALWKNYLELL